MGIGDWGLGIGEWGLGPITNPEAPIPNNKPQSPYYLIIFILFLIFKKLNLNFIIW